MSGGNYRSPNQIRLDILWRQFVASDPELSRIEREKADIYHRRITRLYARQKRAQRLRTWRRLLTYATAAVFIELAFISAFLAILCLA